VRPLGIESVIVVRASFATSTRDNSQYRDWANATQTTISGCNVQSFILSEKLLQEKNAEREFIQQVYRVWAPAGTDVQFSDRIIWRGVEYDVLGVPGVWNHIMGPEHHRDFMIRLREG